MILVCDYVVTLWRQLGSHFLEGIFGLTPTTVKLA
jgi:hypothetical protein